ncbi:MAG: RDD family protein [Archangium gephyra]|uniref:RDD family protein n=1 Tax=Archangium gephyra TaxID=48 RepID=A0A2W5UXR1_9BACT|nr:MAG: RDD family protein [Archangium gephyra]
MSDSLNIATAERVAVELPVAGLGSRAMAWLVDAMIMWVVALVAYFSVTFFVADPLNAVMTLAAGLRVGAIVTVLLLLWAYWTVFELRWNGQTPGKRLLRIRVVKADGSPVTPFASAVRNLMRLVDFLPTCYPVGTAVMLVDSKHRRLGDLLAGTLLVRDEQIDLSRYEQVRNVSLDVDVVEIASSWLVRYAQLEPAHRDRLGRLIAERLQVATDGAPDEVRERIRARLAAK